MRRLVNVRNASSGKSCNVKVTFMRNFKMWATPERGGALRSGGGGRRWGLKSDRATFLENTRKKRKNTVHDAEKTEGRRGKTEETGRGICYSAPVFRRKLRGEEGACCAECLRRICTRLPKCRYEALFVTGIRFPLSPTTSFPGAAFSPQRNSKPRNPSGRGPEIASVGRWGANPAFFPPSSLRAAPGPRGRHPPGSPIPSTPCRAFLGNR